MIPHRGARFYLFLVIILFLQLGAQSAMAFGRKMPKPTPTPTPTPTPSPAPCSTATPWVDHTEDEYVVTLQGVNGKFVSAECGGDDVGAMNANRDAAGEWETFYVSTQSNGDVNIRTSHNRYVSAEGGGGQIVHANRLAVGPWETFHLEGDLSDGAVVGFRTYDGGHFMTARLDMNPPAIWAQAPSLGPWEQFTVHVSYSPLKKRNGVVHAEGRNIVDDNGAFYPLGATVMWALRGWKFERDRLKQNLDYLKKHHYDYIRILGEVAWTGNEIDPSWPDYQQILGELMDYAYDQCGLRVEITLIGGGHEDQAMSMAQKIAAVVHGREHKILDFEVANESAFRNISIDGMRSIGRYLRQEFPNNLVAISSAEEATAYRNTGDFMADFKDVFMRPDSANFATIHMDRGFGDLGWREVRQPWDWKELPFPVSSNEPIGPRSSVAEEVDPVRLAMLRAVGLINGVPAFVLHNGAGVAGQVDPSHNRPANLWEVPNIDAIMDAVRGMDAWFPQRAGDGGHWNNGWAGSPWNVDAFWIDGSDHGVNRNYTVSTGDGWISTEAGLKNYAVFTATRHSLVEVFDILQGKVQEVELQGGEKLTLTPLSTDNNGMGAFIIIGHYR